MQLVNGVYIMESADVVGDVTLGGNCSVWCNAVIRGDDAYVKIGEKTNIQDCAVVHTQHEIPIDIGDNVTIGHGAIVHCRSVGSNTMIGMGALLLDCTEIGEFCIIAAGAIVTEYKKIPDRSIVMGSPGKIVRTASEKDIERIRFASSDYQRLAKLHYEGKYKKYPG